MARYADFYRRSITDRDAFWAEQADLIDWRTLPVQVCAKAVLPQERAKRSSRVRNGRERWLVERKVVNFIKQIFAIVSLGWIWLAKYRMKIVGS